jgi:hypothetical protein
MIIKIKGKCAFENCDEDATAVVCGRESYPAGRHYHPKPACYCDKHAVEVVDEGWPEYDAKCPNCGCLFGVN